MDIDVEQMAIPDTPYKCSVKMPSSEFQRIVRDMQALGDTCCISCTKEGIKFAVTGEIGTGSVLIKANATAKEDYNHVVIDMEEPVELNFAMRYLVLFCKATPISKSVTISLSPNVPVVVEYPIGESGYVKFFLAPKVDDEMDEDNDNDDPAED
jgi:proliferating cell nuclear antigen